MLLLIPTEIKLFDLKKAYENSRFNLLSLDQSLDLSIKCQWISVNSSDVLTLSEHGRAIVFILDNDDLTNARVIAGRQQLVDYLVVNRPYWSSSLTYGRKESLGYLPPNIQDIFHQLYIDNSDDQIIDEDLVSWWDKIMTAGRDESERRKRVIGRFGERLSMMYEGLRTKKPPKYIGLDSNKAGFDILSVGSSSRGDKQICIEVKSSITKKPRIHITRNEWETAETKQRGEYLFHCWILPNPHEIALYIFDSDDLVKELPTNSGTGRWDNCSLRLADLPTAKILKILNKSDLPDRIQNYIDASPFWEKMQRQ